MSLFISVSSFGSTSLMGGLAGDWCGLVKNSLGVQVRTTDFTEILSVKDNGDIILATVGNSAGEVVSYSTGSISVAAVAIYMDLDGEDVPLYDFDLKKRLNGKMMLTMKFEDRETKRFQECKTSLSGK